MQGGAAKRLARQHLTQVRGDVHDPARVQAVVKPQQVAGLVRGDVGQRPGHLLHRGVERQEGLEGVHVDDGLLDRHLVELVHVIGDAEQARVIRADVDGGVRFGGLGPFPRGDDLDVEAVGREDRRRAAGHARIIRNLVVRHGSPTVS